jgi:hypothetical protein
LATDNLTRDYPTVVAAIAQLQPAQVVLDGELGCGCS